MKRQITAILIASLLAIMAPIATSAQSKYHNAKNRENYSRNNDRQNRASRDRRSSERRYDDNYYSDEGYYDYDRPNVYDRHRKAINIGVATGAGAIIGALIGGKKGALIGAAAGVAGGAIVTKVQSPRNRPRY